MRTHSMMGSVDLAWMAGDSLDSADASDLEFTVVFIGLRTGHEMNGVFVERFFVNIDTHWIWLFLPSLVQFVPSL